MSSFESGEQPIRSYPDSERVRDSENLTRVLDAAFEMGFESPAGIELSNLTAEDIDRMRIDGSPRIINYMFYSVTEAALYPDYRAGILNSADLIVYSGLLDADKVKAIELLEQVTARPVLSVPFTQLALQRKIASLGLVADHVNEQRAAMDTNFLIMTDTENRLYAELVAQYGDNPIVWRIIHHLTLAAALLADGKELSETYFTLLESTAALAENYILPNRELQPYVNLLGRLLVCCGYTNLD